MALAMLRGAVRDLMTDPFAGLRRWWKTQKLRAEVRSLPPSVFDALSRDTNLTRYGAEHMLADHPGPLRLLASRLKVAGIDGDNLKTSDPLMYRDLTETCSKCGQWRRCERELRYHDIKAARFGYCLNNGNIEAIKAAAGPDVPGGPIQLFATASEPRDQRGMNS